MKKPGASDAFSKVEHKHENPVASLDYARIIKSIMYLYVTMHKQNAPINILHRSKAPKTQKLSIFNIREKSVIFFNCHWSEHCGRTRKTFVCLGSFAKVQFLYIFNFLEPFDQTLKRWYTSKIYSVVMYEQVFGRHIEMAEPRFR